MAKKRAGDTRARILQAAADLLRASGPDALTFDAVAARVAVSKQAVIYWFPTKADLMSELALPALRAEVAAVERALDGAGSGADAAGRVVRALIGFHLADLPRFRLMYLSVQLGSSSVSRRTASEIVGQVHPITDRMYGAIAAVFGEDAEARRTAVALHMAALGHVLLHALADAVGDPLRHGPDALADRLATMLAAGVEAPPRGND